MAIVVADFGGRYRRYSETGGSNASHAMTVAVGLPFRVLHATVAYSNTPTQAGVTYGIDSGVGATSDSTLSTGSANARYNSYVPTDVPLAGDDGFIVTAPAGGSGITASTVVVVELL